MPSLSEQIVAAVATAVTGTIPSVGTRVFRSREDALVRGEMPAIVVETVSDSSEVVSLDGAVSRVALELAVHVHVQAGDAWESVADLVATPAHALVAAASLPGAARIVSAYVLDDAATGDQTPAVRSLHYGIDLFRSTAALDAAP